MSNPVGVTLTTANTYYKVADNITAGVLNIKAWQPSNYMLTYRTHSGAAPTDDTLSVQCYNRVINVSNTSAIDVYMKCTETLGYVVAML
jgi:hypothetical protein